MADKPKMVVPDAVAKMTFHSQRANWKPEQLLAQEKAARVQLVQQTLADALNILVGHEAIYVEDAIAALGGLVVWLLTMNAVSLRDADNILVDMKIQMRKAVKLQWETGRMLAKLAKEKPSGNDDEAPQNTN